MKISDCLLSILLFPITYLLSLLLFTYLFYRDRLKRDRIDTWSCISINEFDLLWNGLEG